MFKYKEFYGNEYVGYTYKLATPEQAENVNQVLQPNQDNIVAEKSKVVAKLYNNTAPGYIIINTKRYISFDDLLSLDPDTWSQMGEVLQETIKKIEKRLNCHDFIISIN